ncbi:MAG: glycosyltransferase family 4 protein [Candidatus Nanopelagicales bacterium]
MSDHDNGPWDVAHHSSWGSATLPVGISYGPYPFTLGPLGGGQRLLRDLREWFDGPLLENRLRDASLGSVKVNPFARRALGTASAVLVTNSQTMKLVAPLSRRADPELCLAEGIPDDRVLFEPMGDPSTPHIVWLGRFLPRKAASLAVQAFAPLARTIPDVTMSFVGDGPTRPKTESLVHALGISHRVRFLGSLPWNQAQEVLASATVHLFTSVRDSSSAQTLEAAALGIPTVTLALAGAGDFLSRRGFVLVDPHPGHELPDRIADALAEVLRWPLGRRSSESVGALQFARENTWSLRTARLRETLGSACDSPPTRA